MNQRFFHYTGIIVFGLLALVSLSATLIPFIPSKEWWIRIFDYPRLQTFFIALLALIWYSFFYFKREKKGYVFVIMFLVVIGIQGYKAWAYTPLGKKQVLWSEGGPADTTHISLFISNVLQTNTAYDQLIDKIGKYDPDIIITTESDSLWQEGLSSIENKYPYSIPIPLSNTYGMHLYSRLPLENPSVRYLVEPDIPSIRTRVKLSSGEWITLFVVHPRPPAPSEASDTRERDAEIIMVAREARKEKEGVIVAGDFNDVAWSETTELFQEVSGYLDPRRGRGFYNTYHAKFPVFRWPLDHIFHSSHFKLVSMERCGSVNSDHFPMFIHLSYEPEEKKDQPKVKPDKETETDAGKTIRKGKSDPDAPSE
ncbi:MAG: endonuclease/exonuclease/phosphatase family protein [Chitinophagaceae bacterium]